MIITLAGHVDHGKTSLVQCLTGQDTDRLAEEKRRGLTIDVGHLAVTESEPWADHLAAHAEDLIHLHLDDTRNRVHEHLPLGEGEIDWLQIIATLGRIGYAGLALVELSRHSHVAPIAAQRSEPSVARLVRYRP